MRFAPQVNVLARLKHPNIVKYHDCFMDNAFLIIIMEYCSAGDLSGLIKKQAGQLLPEKHVMFLFIQVRCSQVPACLTNWLARADSTICNFWVLLSAQLNWVQLNHTKLAGCAGMQLHASARCVCVLLVRTDPPGHAPRACGWSSAP